MSSRARILIVEDHPLCASGVRAALDASGHQVVEQASTLAEAQAALERYGQHGVLRPDVAMVDVGLPDGSGVTLVARLGALGIGCVVFTGRTTAACVREVVAAGALGFVSKTARFEIVLEALGAALRGERYLCQQAQLALEEEEAEVVLTPREREVLGLIAAGRSNRQIASALGVAPRTVESHRERLMQKLDAHNAADLTRAAMKRELVRRH